MKLRQTKLAFGDGVEPPKGENSPELNGKLLRCSEKKKKKSVLKRGVRSLSSKEGEPPPPPCPTVVEKESPKGKRKRKKRKKKGAASHDEFLRTKRRLQYLLKRMRYERNLLDVYSADGWKGLSTDKLKPEQELHRAKNELLRCKSSVRGLFQHLAELCAVGRLQESLFDKEGQINSEDIFCSKCGSEEMSSDNDIILCDGVCERGFHQFCLDPPLAEIPDGDDGWLCPCCDCKDDCLDLLNEYLGTRLSIEDEWEKIFPEVAADDIDDVNTPPPCDDSHDTDDRPDGSTSASSGDVMIEAIPHVNGSAAAAPDDDDEDDDGDYDPHAVSPQRRAPSSGSDFTSDSEDVGGIISEQNGVGDDNPTDEVVSGKRSVERLDYKTLYAEAYGGERSESSEDEDWVDKKGKRKKKKGERAVVTETSSSPCRKLGSAVTQTLYEAFKENQYPDREMKGKLSADLGITVKQVAKWFDNARMCFRSAQRKNVPQNDRKRGEP